MTSVPPSSSPRPHEAALAYAARGWSVIPMQPHGKRPLVVWRDFQQRAASREQIDGWFARWPDANVGLVTGRISGLVVIDVDARHGGAQSLAQLEGARGALPTTVTASTGGGGRHLYFAQPAAPVGCQVALRPGLDLRGEGGCVVAPPSVHPSGNAYTWVPGRAPHECPLAPFPAHFFEPPPMARSIGHSHWHWRRLIREGIGEGERNNTIASITGHLLWRDVDLDIVLELMLAWNRTHCRPPLPDEEVVQVVHSIARTRERHGDEVARPWDA